MKNFEKYEKEIKEKLADKHKGFKVLEEIAGKEFEYTYDVIVWLYEEYEEPLLTDEEKEYLDCVIEPFRERVNLIMFCKKNIHFDYDAHYTCSIPNTFDNDKLLNHSYTLKELGL